ncbi:MAG: hypothetical protein K1X57_21940 [Gemmataceae bacterium]|nr:hypothetical protein [Gemmataceae bacterium]
MRLAGVLTLFFSAVALAGEPKPVLHDFEGTKVGDVPKGWSVAKTGTGDGSAWEVVQDKTAPKGGKALAQIAKSENSVFNLCVVDDTAFRDVEASVAFKAIRGESDQGGGIVWRYADANNYYVARFNPLEDNYRLYHVASGKRTQIGGKEGLKVKTGDWHTLTVRMVGESITCSLDSKAQIQAKDKTHAKAGKVGLWTKADARTYFDEFTATEVK